MKTAFRCTLACVALALGATRSDADTLIFDNYTSQAASYNAFTSRSAESAPLTFISNVAANTTISEIGVYNDLSAAGSIKFLIADGTTKALLYTSGAKAFAGDGASNSWKYSDPLSFTLLAGHSYYIGLVANVAMTEPYTVQTAAYTQGGITSSQSDNGNVTGFASPVLGGDGGAGIPLQLFTPGAAVPEPASVLLAGAGLAVLLSASRRRKAA